MVRSHSDIINTLTSGANTRCPFTAGTQSATSAPQTSARGQCPPAKRSREPNQATNASPFSNYSCKSPGKGTPTPNKSVRGESTPMARPPVDTTPSESSFHAGESVRVVGLLSMPGLNGMEGVCETWDGERLRWHVRLASGTLKSFKLENLSSALLSPQHDRASGSDTKHASSPALSTSTDKQPTRTSSARFSFGSRASDDDATTGVDKEPVTPSEPSASACIAEAESVDSVPGRISLGSTVAAPTLGELYKMTLDTEAPRKTSPQQREKLESSSVDSSSGTAAVASRKALMESSSVDSSSGTAAVASRKALMESSSVDSSSGTAVVAGKRRELKERHSFSAERRELSQLLTSIEPAPPAEPASHVTSAQVPRASSPEPPVEPPTKKKRLTTKSGQAPAADDAPSKHRRATQATVASHAMLQTVTTPSRAVAAKKACAKVLPTPSLARVSRCPHTQDADKKCAGDSSASASADAAEADQQSTTQTDAPAATAEDPPKKQTCDKCDGPHPTDSCPHFKKPREKHKDAWAGYGTKKLAMGTKGVKFVLKGARLVRQPGDGSCLFHSLCFGLNTAKASSGAKSKAAKRDAVRKHVASALRKEIARFVQEHPQLKIAGDTLEEWVRWDARTSHKNYARRMAVGGWGGGIEMAVCARLKQVNVHVYETETKKPGQFQRISCFNFPKEPKTKRTIHVLYQGRMHYDALVVDH